jgi:hypothetical protein
MDKCTAKRPTTPVRINPARTHLTVRATATSGYERLARYWIYFQSCFLIYTSMEPVLQITE